MRKVCFVTNEIFPVRPGGAGNLIYELARRLLAENIQVIFLLDLPWLEFRQFLDFLSRDLEIGERCRAYKVDELCRTAHFRRDDFMTRYDWESACYHHALRQVFDLEQPDLVEFVDYCGPAYYALCARISGLAYSQTRLAVRAHGSIQEIDRRSARTPDLERLVLYAMESAALRLADVVLYPTPSYLSDAITLNDLPWFGEAICSPPPVSAPVSRAGETDGAHIFLYYGRLYPVKGADVFVQAGLTLLAANHNCRLDFCLVGGDSGESPDPSYASYAAYLRSLVPTDLQSHFSFPGFLDAQRLQALLPEVLAAAFPSRYESFCLAAHELRQAGIPLLLADLPAFRDHFAPEQDALYFTSDAAGLAAQAQRLLDDPELRRRLAQKPQANSVGDPLAFYHREHIPGWLQPSTGSQPASLLVLVLDENNNLENWQLSRTVLAACEDLEIRILHLIRSEEGMPDCGQLFGKTWQVLDEAGRVQPWQVTLAREAVLMIEAGAVPVENLLRTSLQTLKNQPRVAGVSGWKVIGNQLSTRPVALVPQIDLIPPAQSPLSILLRTRSGSPLFEQFDPETGYLAEAVQLWNLEEQGMIGLQLPDVLFHAALDKSPASVHQIAAVPLLESILSHVSDHRQSILQPWLEWFRTAGVNSRPSRRSWSERLVDRLSRGDLASRRLLGWLRQVKHRGSR